MAGMEKELRLLKQKVDLLLDGYQVLYMKLEQQNKALLRIEQLFTMFAPQAITDSPLEPDTKVVRLSERFLHRVRKNFQETLETTEPDEPQPS